MMSLTASKLQRNTLKEQAYQALLEMIQAYRFSEEAHINVEQISKELGVSRIIPLFTEHCGVRLDGERRTKRLQHWQGVVVSACEQVHPETGDAGSETCFTAPPVYKMPEPKVPMMSPLFERP